MRSFLWAAAVLLCLSMSSPTTRAADESAAAGDADAVDPQRELVKWNEHDGSFSTFRFGFGFLVDYAAWSQDEENEQQIAMEENDSGVRDFRVLFKGKFKTKRPFSWTLGYMYDGADDEWRFRQTGFQIGFAELHGSLFIGRTKEGYSNIKVMVGYHGWTMERSSASDAFIPILADGLKWSGYFEKTGLFYSVGVYGDALSEHEKFSTFDHQIATRVGWLPILSKEHGKVLHLAVMARAGTPDEGMIQVRARPESNLAPYFLDTGKFAADHARVTGVEGFYRSGPWLYGVEYNWENVEATSGESPTFDGGDAVVSWLITGETRPYNAAGGFFQAVSPARTVFDGGKGAWEAVLHFGYADFDSGSFQGGKLWKLTPMVNWHLSDNVRLEMGYGYSELDRFSIVGHTQFFQTRLQLTL